MAKRTSAPKGPQADTDQAATPKKPRAKRTSSPEARPVEIPDVEAKPVDAPYEPTQDEIRHRAYERFLERGGGHGSDFDDWLHAEQDLRRRR